MDGSPQAKVMSNKPALEMTPYSRAMWAKGELERAPLEVQDCGAKIGMGNSRGVVDARGIFDYPASLPFSNGNQRLGW